MTRHWEDKFVVIDQINANEPFNVPLSVARTIQTPNYVSHFSRTYKIKNTTYVATVFTFQRSEDNISLKIQPQLQRVLRKMQTKNIGSGPKLQDKTPMVMYVIFDKYQVYHGAYSDKDQEEQLHAEPLLILKGEFFKFQETNFSMTRVVNGVYDGDPPKSSLPEHFPRFSLEAKFVQPEGFKQGEASQVVESDANIGDFIELSLLFHRPKTGNSKLPMFLSRVAVELQELLWSQGMKTDLSSDKDSLLHVRGKWLLWDHYNWGFEPDFTSSSDSIVIPKRFFDCKLPEVGPTFFSHRLLRSYRISIEVEFGIEGTDNRFWSNSFTDICVAEKGCNISKRFTSLSHVLPRICRKAFTASQE